MIRNQCKQSNLALHVQSMWLQWVSEQSNRMDLYWTTVLCYRITDYDYIYLLASDFNSVISIFTNKIKNIFDLLILLGVKIIITNELILKS